MTLSHEDIVRRQQDVQDTPASAAREGNGRAQTLFWRKIARDA
ncbi:MAG: hypothetical protein ABF888_08565 [Acetobacter papayae]